MFFSKKNKSVKIILSLYVNKNKIMCKSIIF